MLAGPDAEATAVTVAVPTGMLFVHRPALITGLVAEHYARWRENRNDGRSAARRAIAQVAAGHA